MGRYKSARNIVAKLANYLMLYLIILNSQFFQLCPQTVASVLCT